MASHFALDIAAEWLCDAGIESALIHGGTSTTYAIGTPPDQDAWKVAVVRPEDGAALSESGETPAGDNILATVELRDSSLSVSAIWGKSFELDGETYGHVIDPRTGRPVSGAFLAAVVASTATETDALATALLTLGRDRTTEMRSFRCDSTLLRTSDLRHWSKARGSETARTRW